MRASEPCGCVTDVDERHGVTYCAYKCDFHRDWHANNPKTPREYYAPMCFTEDGFLTCGTHWRELTAEVPMLPVPQGTRAIEVGCGCSMYAPALLGLGYSYTGLEENTWAAQWTREAYCVDVINATLERARVQQRHYSLVLAAHVVEHLRDSPAGVAKMITLLHEGGRLVVIVPDDRDKCNPDHWWFYTRDSLEAMLSSMGLRDVRVTQKSVVAHEDFLYATGVKT